MKLSIRNLTLAVLGVVLLAACESQPSGRGPGSRQLGTGMSVDQLQPHIRDVAAADHDLLWQAARDYMAKAFPVDTVSEEKRLVESHLMEWEENRMLHRTRVTVEVRPSPTDPGNAQIGIVAQLIEPRYELDKAQTGRPAWNGWVLLGTNQKIAEIVGDQILRRYYLLRHGKDPDATPQKDPFRRYEKTST